MSAKIIAEDVGLVKMARKVLRCLVFIRLMLAQSAIIDVIRLATPRPVDGGFDLGFHAADQYALGVDSSITRSRAISWRNSSSDGKTKRHLLAKSWVLMRCWRSTKAKPLHSSICDAVRRELEKPGKIRVFVAGWWYQTPCQTRVRGFLASIAMTMAWASLGIVFILGW